ncbi:hypothetical protein D3C80_1529490 [compost metagenome]
MLGQAVNAVDLLHHMHGVDFNQLFTVNGQLEVGAFGRHLGFGVFPLLVLAKVDFLMAATQYHFHGGDLTGIVTLERTGKAQRHRIDAAPLLQHQFIQAAHRPLQGQGIIVQPHIGRRRAIHAAAAILLQLAGELGQGERGHHAHIAVTVVEQVQVLQFFRQCHNATAP